MIYPEIFNGFVLGFFTDRDMGLSVADAVVTDIHGILLGVQVADCVPILLCDGAGRSIGAVHAGWKGTAAGILKGAIRQMKEAYGSEPGDILVSMGPAIRWCCYIVGRDVFDDVSKATGEGEYSMMMDDSICLDLQSANKHQALSAGIRQEHISIVEDCTFCYPKRYYSHRYITAKGNGKEKNEGRQGGFIGFP
jgi:YfiH family protein